jgi:hypothetical protein
MVGDRSSATLYGVLGDAAERAGLLGASHHAYARAVERARAADGVRTVNALHRWEFQLERSRSRHGDVQVDDPLFDVSTTLHRPLPASSVPYLSANAFDVTFDHLGVRVHGFVTAPDARWVDIRIDEAPIRRVNLGGPAKFPEFTITLRRDVIARLPRACVVTVTTADHGRLLANGRARGFTLRVPHGQGDLLPLLRDGGNVDKKGGLQPAHSEVRARQDAYLGLYARARRFFEQELDQPLLLLYGTLLGVVRGGDLI